MKRGGGRRYYRPDDVDLLRGVRYLLYGEGYTIRGVQRILREQGAAFVQNVWRADAEPPPPQLEEDRAGERHRAGIDRRAVGAEFVSASLMNGPSRSWNPRRRLSRRRGVSRTSRTGASCNPRSTSSLPAAASSTA